MVDETPDRRVPHDLADEIELQQGLPAVERQHRIGVFCQEFIQPGETDVQVDGEVVVDCDPRAVGQIVDLEDPSTAVRAAEVQLSVRIRWQYKQIPHTVWRRSG